MKWRGRRRCNPKKGRLHVLASNPSGGSDICIWCGTTWAEVVARFNRERQRA